MREDGGWGIRVGDVGVNVSEVGPLVCCSIFAIFLMFIPIPILVVAIYAIYSHLVAFTASWDHLDVVVRLDSLRGDQRSLLL